MNYLFDIAITVRLCYNLWEHKHTKKYTEITKRLKMIEIKLGGKPTSVKEGTRVVDLLSGEKGTLAIHPDAFSQVKVPAFGAVCYDIRV